jgi:hypothetical protein
MTTTDTSTTGKTDTTTKPDSGGTDTGATDLTAEVEKWKSLARKHEQASKTNETAAAELQRLKDSQKSEADRAAERAAQAETRLAELESRVLRRDIALEHKLSSEDAAMLDAMTDETAMRNLAKRLAGAAEGEHKKKSNVVPREGTTSSKAADDPVRAFTRDLFGRSDE